VRIDRVPEGRLKFIPMSSRKTRCSFSRPFWTHAIWNSPSNVENVGLFSEVPPGQWKPVSFRCRKTFLMAMMVSILSHTLFTQSPGEMIDSEAGSLFLIQQTE
jgi:hypothetical protein